MLAQRRSEQPANNFMPKYKINDVVENTCAFGTCKVIDVFKSPTTGHWCYHVTIGDNDTFLAWEAELNPD